MIYIDFTHFNTEREYDFVTLTDAVGTDLADLTDRYNGGNCTTDRGTVFWGKKEDQLPFAYIPSNIVHVHFYTDGDTQRSGWRLEWEAVV